MFAILQYFIMIKYGLLWNWLDDLTAKLTISKSFRQLWFFFIQNEIFLLKPYLSSQLKLYTRICIKLLSNQLSATKTTICWQLIQNKPCTKFQCTRKIRLQGNFEWKSHHFLKFQKFGNRKQSFVLAWLYLSIWVYWVSKFHKKIH